MKKSSSNDKDNILKKIEDARKMTIRNLFLLLLVLVLLFFLLDPSSNLCFCLIAFVIIITFVKYSVDKGKFDKLYKDNIVLACLQDVFTDVEYRPYEGISESKIAATKMMNTGNCFSSSDYVKAKYKDIAFECSDVLIQHMTTDSDGNSSYTTIFMGQWYIFDFNKSFKSKVQVCEKRFGGNIVGNSFDSNRLKKVELEDVNFHKFFEVYAKDEVEAFYILTPPMIERIKKLNEDVAGKFLFCFCDNKLHVGLYNNKDLYEHNIFSKVNLEKAKNKVLGELLVIIKFVDILKLDDSLFKSSI